MTTTTWTPDADVVGTLTELGVDANSNPTGWIYVNEQDETETYTGSGTLISIINKAGHIQTLTYSDGTTGTNGGYVLDALGNPNANTLPVDRLIRETDSFGHTIQYGYDVAGRVVKMTDPAGGVYLYTYSDTTATANLTSVTYPDGKTRTYLYGEPANVSATPDAGVSYAHALTGIIDENGSRYASWTYDAADRATSSEHGPMGSGIDKVTLAYTNPDTNGNSTTTVQDVMGTIRTYNFSTILGVVKNTGITGLPCNGCSAAFAYDANGNVTSRTDFNGITTTYTYDLTRNLELSRTEAFGTPQARTITTQWHPTYRLPTLVIEPLRTTTYTYDAQGNLLTLAIQPIPGIGGGTGQPRTTNYTYNNFGQVLSIDGPRLDAADITTYNYDPLGNLVTVSNALNQATTLGAYDLNGRVGTITNPNGLTTYLTYDPRGRLTHRTTGSDNTHYTYDGVGNLTNVALPNGATYTYTYDQAHRLTQISDAQNNRIVYNLDAAGNRTREETFDTNGTLIQTHSRVFDALNRLYQDIGAVNQTTTYTYDANGNLTSITDPLNRLSTNLYDALNRLNQVTNPDLGSIRYAYDAQDQLSSVTDPKNLTTQYTRDGLGNLNQTISPDTGSSSASYDPAGNVITKTDAKGQIATYTYDALNRLTGINYGGGTPAIDVNYIYDQGVNGIGHLTSIADHTGNTQYSYNQNGRLNSETRQSTGSSVSYTTAYAYDSLGRQSGITYPSGRTVNYSFDSMGRISQIDTTLGATILTLLSNVVYEPFGGVRSFTFGDGFTAPVQTYTRQRDLDGRIASYTLNAKVMTLAYDAASQITTLSDSQNPLDPASFGYDSMSRLTAHSQGIYNQGYSYDVDGNRTSQLLGSSSTTNYGYVPGSNRLASIQSGASTPQPVSHDANGSLTADGTRQYSYDVRGRLLSSTTALGSISYEVNALGLRVRKQAAYDRTDTQYHYDAHGHLIGETPTGSSHFTREYIYLGDQPVAVMK